MDTSSLVNLYDRLDDQRKEKSISKTPSFDFGQDDKSEADFKLPDSIPTAAQGAEVIGSDQTQPDVTEPPRLGLPEPTKQTFTYRPPQSLIDKMRAQDEMQNDPSSPQFDQDYDSFWRKKINHHCDKVKDRCCKHIILDIYCKTLPLDHDYVCKNKRMLSDDIDVFLDKKKMAPYQYLTAAKQATDAPLLKHLLDETDLVSRNYYERAYKEALDNQRKNIMVNPQEPSNGDLVDVSQDSKYNQFIENLKEQTRDKIVKDVTNLIKNSNDGEELEFKPGDGDIPNQNVMKKKSQQEFAPEVYDNEKNSNPDGIVDMDDIKKESVLLQCMDYGSRKFIKENIEMNSKMNEEMIGLAIRESTLWNIDRVFKLKNHEAELNNLQTNLFLNKGIVFNKENLAKISK